jgi:crossover junction endodeoxyribonuclease RusA
MSVEIEFPLEFVVLGTPVSLQSKRRESLEEWKGRVVEASRTVLPEGHFVTDDPLAVTLYYFPDSEMQGDIDNIIKPILDALEQHIYRDDRQIQRILAQKFEPGNVFGFTQPSSMLENALEQPKPLLYVRLSDDPFEDLV